MAKTIHKYTLQITESQSVPMPEGAIILAVKTQRDQPRIWAMVNTEAPRTVRRFVTFGTGHPMPDNVGSLQYIGTYLIHQDSLVFHVFEEGI